VKYDRIPKLFFVLFDIEDMLKGTADNSKEEPVCKYLNYDQKKKEADRLGLECPPLLLNGNNAQ